MQVITHWSTLMRLAKAVGDAKVAGDPRRLETAQAELEAYRQQCLRADVMSLGMSNGELLRQDAPT